MNWSDYYEDLYEEFYPIACGVVVGFIGGVKQHEVFDIANHIVSDFFVSKSYRHSFDGTRDIVPFFHEYARKRVKRYREDLFVKPMKRERLINSEYTQNLFYQDMGIMQFEVNNYALSLVRFLENRMFYGERESIELQQLFILQLKCHTENGRTNLQWLSERLGCSKNVVKSALARMRQLLREVMEDESHNFHWVHEGSS